MIDSYEVAFEDRRRFELRTGGILIPTTNLKIADILTVAEIRYKVKYYFTDKKRVYHFSFGTNKGTYGSRGMTFRRLYKLLSDRFQYGVKFLDYYFELYYPNRVGIMVDRLLKEAIAKIIRAGNYRNLTIENIGLLISKFYNTRQTELEELFNKISFLIKQDIKQCMSTGVIAGLHKSKRATEKLKKSLGLSTNTAYYASGQLIDNLRVYTDFEFVTGEVNV